MKKATLNSSGGFFIYFYKIICGFNYLLYLCIIINKKMKDIIYRVYSDVKNNPDSYPINWIKKDGIPYWQWVKEGSGAMTAEPLAQMIIDLFNDMVKKSENNLAD